MLLAVLAVVSGLAYRTSHRRSAGTAPSSMVGKSLLPDLPVNDVEKLVFRDSSGVTTISRTEQGWVAPDRFSYPIKFDKVRDFLRKLSDLKIGQVVRADKKDMANMGLVQPNGPSTNSTAGTGILVTLEGGNGKPLASLLMGNMLKTSGRYVAAGNITCIVAETLSDAPAKPTDWMDDELFNIDSYNISDIRVEGPDRDPVALKCAEGGSLQAEGLAPDQETDTSKVSTLSGAFSYLRFADIADPKLSDAQTGMDKAITCTAKAKDGRCFTIKVGGMATGTVPGRYIRVSAEYKPAQEVASPTAANSNTGSTVVATGFSSNAPAADVAALKTEEEKAKAAARERLTSEVKALNTTAGKWTYIMGESSAESLLAKQSEYIRKKEAQKETGSGKAEAGQNE